MQPSGHHITLAFLGNQPADRVPEIASAMDDAVSGMAPLTLSPAALGSFRNHGIIQVVWAGVEDQPAGALAALRLRLTAALESHRIGFDEAAFRPHITLGRARRSGDREGSNGIRNALSGGGAWASQPLTTTEITLFQSILQPNGAFYTALHLAAL